jgi:poly-gamma-glutamate synthesis protein (capsule biosynthesis protein)
MGMVGDLLVDRDQPDEVFQPVRGALAACDVLFGNLEGAFTDRPHAAPSVTIPLFPKRHNLDCFARAGFNVMSLANNHSCDAGHEVLLENRTALLQQGVATSGAGANLAEAREPAIIERNGVRIAFLSYASFFPFGYEARGGRPGVAPFRSYDHARPAVDNVHAPGMTPRMITVLDETDVANLIEDLAIARASSDVVVAGFHWGDYLRPFHLTDHEKKVARLSVDAGADVVVGHHHHSLRGMEWYKGKPVLYGLGHFVLDFRLDTAAPANLVTHAVEEYDVGPREGWPLLPLHPDTRMTALAVADLDRTGVTRLAYLPCMLRPDGCVVPYDAGTPEAQPIIAYMNKCNETQGLNGTFELAEDMKVDGMRLMRLF